MDYDSEDDYEAVTDSPNSGSGDCREGYKRNENDDCIGILYTILSFIYQLINSLLKTFI